MFLPLSAKEIKNPFSFFKDNCNLKKKSWLQEDPKLLNNPYLDGEASIVIGAILLAVATFLAKESKGLLLGESAHDDIIDDVHGLINANEYVKASNMPQTMHFGPDKILIIVEVDLKDDLELHEADKIVNQLRTGIKENNPAIQEVYIQTTS